MIRVFAFFSYNVLQTLSLFHNIKLNNKNGFALAEEQQSGIPKLFNLTGEAARCNRKSRMAEKNCCRKNIPLPAAKVFP